MTRLRYLWIPVLMMLSLELTMRVFPAFSSSERDIRSVLFTYLESDKPSEVVLVGSSIFANIIDEAFVGIKNLGFDGGNALTGLKIMSEENDQPKVIFVEMGINSLAQSQGVHLSVLKLFEQRENILWRRKWLHSSRKENNLHRRFRAWVRNLSTVKQGRGVAEVNPYFYKRALAQYIHRQEQRTRSGFYDRDIVIKWLMEQKEMIDNLISGGSEVVLVRPPEANKMRIAREYEYRIERNIFPEKDYNWIDAKLMQVNYGTSDGIHLLRDDSTIFLEELMKMVKSSGLNTLSKKI